MKIDVDLPKFDIPKDFIVGDGITGDILNMYGLFPCKIKAGVFAFCTRGTIRVTINLDEHTARANDFITLLPNTFIQIHEVSEDAEVCFVAFSSRFLESINFIRTISNLIVTIIENPVVPLSGNAAAIYKDFFSLLVRADNAPDSILFTDSLKPVLDLLIQGVVNMYRRFNTWKEPVLSRDKEIAREFVQLVWQYYTKERSALSMQEVADHLASFLLRDQKDDRDDSPRYYCQRRDNGCQSPTEINESPDKGNLYRTGLQQRRFLRQVFPSLRGDVTAGVSQQLSQPSYLNLFRLK